jgi:flagellar hook-length control protein FliK
MQRNASADDQAARDSQRAGGTEATLPKAGGGSPAVGDPAAVIVEPFSELLARQMGSHTSITVQDTSATDPNAATGDTVTAAKEARDQNVIAANASGDTASILAAMLLHIPATQGRGQNAEEGSPPPLTAGSGEPAGLPLAGAGDSGELRQMTEGDFQQADPASPISLSTEVSEHAEFAANPASPPQNGTAQPITPSALSAVMPNTPSHNAAGITQTITTPLGSSAWAEEFTQKISWMCTQQNQVAELHLNPPNLGPLDVVLKIAGNQATVLFTSPHGTVREAVENALPKLREILADNGIMLGNATVSDQSPQDRSADGNMNHGFGTADQRAILDEASSPTGLSPANSRTGPARRHNGLVDTFA